MSGRPLTLGGVTALVVGGLLLALGLGPGRGGAEPVGASPTSRAAPDVAWGVAPPQILPSTQDPSADSYFDGTAQTAGSGNTGRANASSSRGGASPSGAAPTPPARHVSGVRLEVPSIGLDLDVHGGGVSSSGRVVPPVGRATWVRGFGRVAPGGVGTAVVAGHVSAHGRRDVFADLSSVRVGHELVVRSGSVVRTYAVTRVSVVDKAKLTRDAEVWGPNGSHRRLVLITCDDDLGYREDGHRVANYVVVAEAI